MHVSSDPSPAHASAPNVACDVLVIGSGAGGMATAIVARKAGLDVIICEKAPVFGGTTAYSGGVLWIPGNAHGKANAPNDSADAARTYLRAELGNFYDESAIDMFLANGPEMLEFFERETEVRFVPTMYPDYHPTRPGGVDVGRAVMAAPYRTTALGENLKRLRPPLATITFVGMMFNSANADLKHFFNATRSWTSFAYVVKRLASHGVDLLRYRRGVMATSGNALAARLAQSVFGLGIPLHTDAPVLALAHENGRVTGAQVRIAGKEQRIDTRLAVVLACGGFPHDPERTRAAYPHIRRGATHASPTPVENTGDGIRLAETVGGQCELRFPHAAAWMPVSLVPGRDGRHGVFPHLLDRYKPGIIAVNRRGERFCNESESYHDVGAAMIRTCEDEPETAAWLICDHRAIRKYGLGHAKPAPFPVQMAVANGYIKRGATLVELAAEAGIDAEGLARTVEDYNLHAERGEDPAFGRGSTSFNRYLADASHGPNPCVAPIRQGPFYALKIVVGDLGSFDGLTTDAVGRVLDDEGQPIPGLYAAGNDRASIMGGNYPGAGITLGPIMTLAYVTGRQIASEAGK